MNYEIRAILRLILSVSITELFNPRLTGPRRKEKKKNGGQIEYPHEYFRVEARTALHGPRLSWPQKIKERCPPGEAR